MAKKTGLLLLGGFLLAACGGTTPAVDADGTTSFVDADTTKDLAASDMIELKAEVGLSRAECQASEDGTSFCFDFAAECPGLCELQDADCGTIAVVHNGHALDCPCGECADNEICVDADAGGRYCCATDCADSQCGDDGCGSVCGECPMGWECDSKKCKCIAACQNKECGPDNCGGSCGNCPSLEICGIDGNCLTKSEALGLPTKNLLKINFLEVGDGGTPGHALDVDQDPATCAPPGSCAGGLDNQLSGMAKQLSAFVDISAELAALLESGDLVLLAHMTGFVSDGGLFTMNMHVGQTVQPEEICDWQTQTCDYLIPADEYDPVGEQWSLAFNNASIQDGKFTAGGPGYKVSFPTHTPDGETLALTGHWARVEGTPVLDGNNLVGLEDAILGAAISKAELCDWLENFASEDMPVQPGGSFCTSLSFLPDIDLDNDGELDAMSLGIRHQAIAGNFGGFANCEPQCDGKQCGPDGCGWTCGTCPDPSDLCQEGSCQPCVPECGDKECGPDGCGWVCGICTQGPNQLCTTAGKCESCPGCEDVECGTNICGQSCGDCPPELACVGGTCSDPNCPVGVVTCEEGSLLPQGTLLHLGDEASFVPGGYDSITGWLWSVSGPSQSQSDFQPSPSVSHPTFVVDAPGEYVFFLELQSDTDLPPCMGPAYAVKVFGVDGIRVELRWDTPGDPDQTNEGPEFGADLDLHLLHPWAAGSDLDGDGQADGWYDQLFDCFWFNPDPQWGCFDPAIDDDPHLVLDDKDGAGPDILVLHLPQEPTYRVGVHSWDDHEFGGSSATLQVFIHGVLVHETPTVWLDPLDMWEALLIEMPAGNVNAITDQAGNPKIIPNYPQLSYLP